MITIITDEKKIYIGEKLQLLLQQSGNKVTLLSIADSKIKPCYSCGGCETKTYGKCVVRDDMDLILPKLAESDYWIYITNTIWGNPSYQTKKVFDKSALLGSRFYKTRHGELVKGNCVGAKRMAVIGVADQISEEEKQDFVFWAKEMANIIDLKCVTAVWNSFPEDKDLQNFSKEIMNL